MVNGGTGITFVPHDPNSSVPPCDDDPAPAGSSCVGPAFLETSHTTAELDLLRYYSDDGSTLHRPFIAKEAQFAFNTNLGGTDSRGIAIDPTPRLTGKAWRATRRRACADTPARVYRRQPHAAVARHRRDRRPHAEERATIPTC